MTPDAAIPAARFDPNSLDGLPEPVRRYLNQALLPGASLDSRIRLLMRGRINVGTWLAFTAEQRFDGHAFEWRARAGWGRLKPLSVIDTYRDGAGSTEGTLLGRLRFMHADDHDTARAAAGRAAAESIWVPAELLPQRGVDWRVEGPNVIVARVRVPPEHPELRLEISDTGAVRRVSLMRWGNIGQDHFGYIPFGGEIHAERRFGDVVIPSSLTVGWWYGTPRYKPFFQAEIIAADHTR